MDLGLDSDGDIPLYGRPITGAEQVAQRVRIRLGTHLGEDPRDATRGLPYVSWLTTRPVPVTAIVARIRREVADTDGVISVAGWTGTLDRDTGALTISGSAVVVDNVQLRVVARPLTPAGPNSYPAVVIQATPILAAP